MTSGSQGDARIRTLVIPVAEPAFVRHLKGWPDMAEIYQVIGGFANTAYPTHLWHIYFPYSAAGFPPLNPLATRLVGPIPPVEGGVHGTAVVVGSGTGGQDADVPESVVSQALAEARHPGSRSEPPAYAPPR